MSTLVVGDIHGCLVELHDLIEAAGIGDGDEVVSVGDLVDRGPDTPGVIDFFRGRSRARAVQGNHERKHVRWSRQELHPALSQRIARRQLGDGWPEALEWMDALPRWLELPEALVVHGFWEPGVALEAQRETVVVGTMSGARRLRDLSRPWYELYDGPKPLIVGHLDYRGDGQPFVWRDRVFCLDTGVVRGGRLTGLLLPEFRLVSVPARRNWWQEVAEANADLRYVGADLNRLGFDAVAAIARGRGERGERAQALLVEADDAVACLLAELRARHAAAIEGLDFTDPRALAAEYARRVKGPLASFLHRLRSRGLDEAALRRHFRKPAVVLEAVRDLGLRGTGRSL